MLKVGVVVAVLFGLVSLLWPILSKGPAGRMIPTDEPNEANRVENAAGFSIVVPNRWKQMVNVSSPDLSILTLHPFSPIVARSRAELAITRQREPVPISNMAAVQFQGLPAHESMEVTREWGIDDPPSSEYRLVFQRGDYWYRLSYSIAQQRTTLPAEIRRYLDTFRTDDELQDRPAVGGP